MQFRPVRNDGELRFGCTSCGDVFGTLNGLNVHARRIHQIQRLAREGVLGDRRTATLTRAKAKAAARRTTTAANDVPAANAKLMAKAQGVPRAKAAP